MLPRSIDRIVPAVASLALLILMGRADRARAGSGVTERLSDLLSGIPAESVSTGVLHDRVLALAPMEAFDGTPEAPAARPSDWRQVYDEIRRASLREPGWPPLAEVDREARANARGGVQTLAVMDFRHDRIRRDALERGALRLRDGRLVLGEGGVFEPGRVTAATALPGRIFRGEAARFRVLDPAVLSNDPVPLASLEVDFGDGRGYIRVAPGREVAVRYEETGEKTVRVRLARADGSVRHAAARLEVKSLRTPAPDDTLHLTASIPYDGLHGRGDAYLYLAPGHASLTEPVIVIEGFDYDNTMNWDELYALLNRENLLEDLRAEGFDAVVLNFTDAVDHIQRNAMVAVELLQQVQAAIGPDRTVALAGASMGGLVGRYALCYMEAHALPHRVRTFLSFDSPQMGADIPLGIQYWLWFFQDDSPDAAALLAALDAPGARQMLAYHHTDPPGSTGQPDPLRGQLLADFAALGDYPEQPRKVAIANGSGARLDQGFAPGAQIIRWEYDSFLIDIVGNVWAVPDGASQTIFRGVVDIIGPWYEESVVTVSNTRPYDGAPGGWRDSMAQMDATPAPYGDIVALHPNHAFIPTVSALALDTPDLFHDIAGDPDLLGRTPFDAVYFPAGGENQEHVAITPENEPWLLAEILAGASGGVESPEASLARPRIREVSPNPSRETMRVVCDLFSAGAPTLTLHDAAGRRVALLADGSANAGASIRPGRLQVDWDGRDRSGRRVPPGVYFLQLRGPGYAASRKVVLR